MFLKTDETYGWTRMALEKPPSYMVPTVDGLDRRHCFYWNLFIRHFPTAIKHWYVTRYCCIRAWQKDNSVWCLYSNIKHEIVNFFLCQHSFSCQPSTISFILMKQAGLLAFYLAKYKSLLIGKKWYQYLTTFRNSEQKQNAIWVHLMKQTKFGSINQIFGMYNTTKQFMAVIHSHHCPEGVTTASLAWRTWGHVGE